MITKTHHGKIEVRRTPGQAVFLLDGKVVASARIRGRVCALRIPGHIWHVTPDMPIARFNQIPGDKITTTVVKAFKSWQAAAKEVERVKVAQ